MEQIQNTQEVKENAFSLDKTGQNARNFVEELKRTFFKWTKQGKTCEFRRLPRNCARFVLFCPIKVILFNSFNKDRLLDRHLCLNLYPCVIKVQSVSPVCFAFPPRTLAVNFVSDFFSNETEWIRSWVRCYRSVVK